MSEKKENKSMLDTDSDESVGEVRVINDEQTELSQSMKSSTTVVKMADDSMAGGSSMNNSMASLSMAGITES